MKAETKLIKFEDGELLGVRDEQDQVWLGVKKACLDIGLNEAAGRRQLQNVQEDLALKSNCHKFVIVQNEGKREVNREVVCINEEVVTLWLAKIHITPSMQKENPKAVQKLLNYQLKAQRVLHEAFMKTEEKKQEFYNDLGIHGDITDLKQKVSSMEETMNKLIDATTINTRQQQRLYRVAKDRINKLLGGAHSDNYKEYGRSYFINMWNDFKEYFSTSSYKDLNPIQFNEAIDYIKDWSYNSESFA